tara:strand:+ start:170 stop:550 length:381 start_codon:yes stop_codon:yes gene_type:complete
MIITLITLSLLLGGYSLYLIKKLDKETNTHLNNINTVVEQKNLYLLNELNSKIKTSEESLLKELKNKIKTSEESLLSNLKEINTQNQENNNKMHQQLVSGEFKKFKSDMDKTLNGMIKNVENIKFE